MYFTQHFYRIVSAVPICIRNVGRYAAKWLIKLNELGVAWEDMHLLGSSLGGHTAGAAGHFTDGRVGRITGLDPSGPLFHMETTEDRLDPRFFVPN